MIISHNPTPPIVEFELLLAQSVNLLNVESQQNSSKYSGLKSDQLEQTVFDTLNQFATGTPFANTIELISGSKFPDIVAKRYYGVEVKGTKKNSWKSVGSSIAEGTRIEGIERIFLFFGKLGKQVEFMCRPYEECLSEIAITHSPRYRIDMELKRDQTIFNRMGVTYDDFRQSSEQGKLFRQYYSTKLRLGDSFWGLFEEHDADGAAPIYIRQWNNLERTERENYKLQGFVYFPEIIGSSQHKFSRFTLWLTTEQAVICPNVRDVFTAGGMGVIEYGNTYYRVPRVLLHLYNLVPAISDFITTSDPEELKPFWKETVNKEPITIDWNGDLYQQWVDIVLPHAENLLQGDSKKMPLAEVLQSRR